LSALTPPNPRARTPVTWNPRVIPRCVVVLTLRLGAHRSPSPASHPGQQLSRTPRRAPRHALVNAVAGGTTSADSGIGHRNTPAAIHALFNAWNLCTAAVRHCRGYSHRQNPHRATSSRRLAVNQVRWSARKLFVPHRGAEDRGIPPSTYSITAESSSIADRPFASTIVGMSAFPSFACAQSRCSTSPIRDWGRESRFRSTPAMAPPGSDRCAADW
jgi:hypothetical protein